MSLESRIEKDENGKFSFLTNLDIFIQSEDYDKNTVRYAAFGKINSENKFSGIIYGYEGGGEYSEGYMFLDKYLPTMTDDEEDCIDDDTQEQMLKELISDELFQVLIDERNLFMTYDKERNCYMMNEKAFVLFNSNNVASNFPNDINPPSYANTYWTDDNRGRWSVEEINALKG